MVTAFGNEVSTDVFESWTNGLLDGFVITGGNVGIGKSKNGAKVTSPAEILNNGDAISGAGILIFKSAPASYNFV